MCWCVHVSGHISVKKQVEEIEWTQKCCLPEFSTPALCGVLVCVCVLCVCVCVWELIDEAKWKEIEWTQNCWPLDCVSLGVCVESVCVCVC